MRRRIHVCSTGLYAEDYRGYMCMRRRIHVYEEEDTCVLYRTLCRGLSRTSILSKVYRTFCRGLPKPLPLT